MLDLTFPTLARGFALAYRAVAFGVALALAVVYGGAL